MASDSVYGQLLNFDSVPINNGEIVRVSGVNRCVRAQADVPGNLAGLAGVSLSGIVGILGPVNICSNGFSVRVRLEAGLAPVAGETLYVSATVAGRATNVVPATPIAIGTIEDATGYALDGRVLAIVSIPGDAVGAGGLFPGFGLNATNLGIIGTAGIGATASRLDHAHAPLVIDGIVTGATQLSTLASAGYAESAWAWVVSVGAPFQLKQGALTVDNLTVVTASGKAGFQWVRVDWLNRNWEAQAAWFVDPQNAYGTSSDEANGATAATALRSYRELARRLTHASIVVAVVVTVRSNLAAGDTPSFTCRVGTGGSVRFEGVPTLVYTGAVTAFTPHAAGAAADDNQMVDATVPASFTASGMLANGILFQRTNGTALYWYAMADLGGAPPAATLRTSDPAELGGVQTNPVAGDTYTASSLPTIGNLQFPLCPTQSITYRFLWHQPGTPTSQIPIAYSHTWVTGSATICLGQGNVVNLAAM